MLKMYIERYKNDWQVARYSMRCGKEVRTVLFASYSYKRCEDFIEYRKMVHEGKTEKQIERRKEKMEKEKREREAERARRENLKRYAWSGDYNMKDIMDAYRESIEF